MTSGKVTHLCGIVGMVLVALVTLSGQTVEPTLTITQPTAEDVLRGQTTLAADVAPATARVRYVTFYVDGEQVCRATARPFQCSWDAGSQSAARSLRVVAELIDGTRLTKPLRTAAPDASRPLFTAAVDAVMVPVRVLDGRGKFVSGLTPDNFELKEDGQVQQVRIAFGDEAPISLLLALDMSSSMQPRLNDLKKAVTTFLDSIRPKDVVSITAFNNTLYTLARAGADARARREALDQLRPAGGTALHDSVIRAVDLLKTQPSPRVIVVFTDGQDVGSIATVDSVRTALQVNNVTLFLVVQGAEPRRGSPAEALSRAARETGGGAWFAYSMNFLKGQFDEIITDISSRYVLSYSPAKPFGDGGWRTLAVRVVGGPTKDYEIKARQGYLALTPEQARGQ